MKEKIILKIIPAKLKIILYYYFVTILEKMCFCDTTFNLHYWLTKLKNFKLEKP